MAEFEVLFLLNVPHILRSIFLQLEIADLYSCRLVCKSWKDFIDRKIFGDKCTYLKLKDRIFADLWLNTGSVQEEVFDTSLGHLASSSISDVGCDGDETFLAAGKNIIAFKGSRLSETKLVHGQELLCDQLLIGKEILIGRLENPVTFQENNISLLSANNSPTNVVMYDRKSLKEVATDGRCADEEYFVSEGRALSVRKTADNKIKLNYIDWQGNKKVPMIFHSTVHVDKPLVKTYFAIGKEVLFAADNNGNAEIFRTSSAAPIVTSSFEVDSSVAPIVTSSFKGDSHWTWIKSMIMSKHFCGTIFCCLHPLGSKSVQESAINVILFCTSTGKILEKFQDLDSYGSAQFSTSNRYFILARADGHLRKHFTVYDHQKKLSVHLEPLESHSHPLRSMQIVGDRALVISFYDKPFEIRVFDVAKAVNQRALSEECEKKIKLPVGVVPFQNRSNDGTNSLALVLFKERGILCYRQLDRKIVVYKLTKAADTNLQNEDLDVNPSLFMQRLLCAVQH